MKHLLCLITIVIGLLLWQDVPAYGQSAAPPRVEALWEAYQQLDYAIAADSARAALDAYEAYSRNELAEIHTVLGLIEFSQNQPQDARDQFTAALSLNPDLTLDPLMVSPKILTFFDGIRDEFSQMRGDEATPSDAVRYVIVEDRRSEAALRSMVLPGWGQLHKGDRTKGRVLLGLWGTMIGGTVAAHLFCASAERDYDAARTPADALERFDTFNAWHKTRNALFIGTAGVWAYSYIDALVTGSSTSRESAFVVAPAFSSGQMHLSLRLRF